MINWWNGLELAQQIFALIAIPSTLILVIQTIMLLIGLGHDSDTDVDTDAGTDVDTNVDTGVDTDSGTDVPHDGQIPSGDDGLALFTVRGILSMLCISGWVGVALLETSMPDWAAVLIATACGILTLIGIAYLMKAIGKLQSNGTVDAGNCVGKVAQVYIPIPAAGVGAGKVNITVQEKFCEFSAITAGGYPLKTGVFVRVVAVSESGILVVEPLATENNEG